MAMSFTFNKVNSEVDFPALERSILDFWQRTDAFERLRKKNQGKPPWSFLDGPITANNPMGVHHAWGRTYKDAYQPLLRHDRPRAALSERLRLPGPLGRGRGRKGAGPQIEAGHRKPRARRPLRKHRPASSRSARSASTSSPASRPSNRSASATGWTGTATTTGPSRPTSEAATSRCRRRTTTRSGAF